MKIINSNNFFVSVGDSIRYNRYVNYFYFHLHLIPAKSYKDVAFILNSREPSIAQVTKNLDFIEVHVKYNNGNYTGISGIIDSSKSTDIWYLHYDGTYSKDMPFRIFDRNKGK
ncbi:MAG: hypothetical protein ACXACY_23895 [Candidatus Hodarchaeales archaeon]|jgi:hypothetical protein